MITHDMMAPRNLFLGLCQAREGGCGGRRFFPRVAGMLQLYRGKTGGFTLLREQATAVLVAVLLLGGWIYNLRESLSHLYLPRVCASRLTLQALLSCRHSRRNTGRKR